MSARRLLAAALAALAGGAAAEVRTWDFRVTLDDREIGRHRFTLAARESGERELRSEARFDVRVLFVDAYRYRHEAAERTGEVLSERDVLTWEHVEAQFDEHPAASEPPATPSGR